MSYKTTIKGIVDIVPEMVDIIQEAGFVRVPGGNCGGCSFNAYSDGSSKCMFSDSGYLISGRCGKDNWRGQGNVKEVLRKIEAILPVMAAHQ